LISHVWKLQKTIINPINVQINQFYWIEINDFAVSVARTALWIAESQMMNETESILWRPLDFLPLKSYTNIKKWNALRIDWNSVISGKECDYIMWNPPFIWAKLTTEEQRQDKIIIFNSDEYWKLDYVSCWFMKSADYMKNTKIKAALVATNSICQWEQPELLRKLLFQKGIKINFAHKTFRRDSEANLKAHVHCVIVWFSYLNEKEKIIFDWTRTNKVKNINAYLTEWENIFLRKLQKSICGAKEMTKGSQLIDWWNFVFSKEEKEKFILKYPESSPYFYRYINADSFLNNQEEKFCICLKDCPSSIKKSCKWIYDIIQKVYEYRSNSEAISTQKLKDRPSEFFITNIPSWNSILIPVVSSERRKYIPLWFIETWVIYTNATNYIDNADLYDFWILISSLHMARMRAFAWRLKSDYRYSKDIVYNNFPRPPIKTESKKKIEQTAKAILDARKLYSDSSLAALYDELTMPSELRRAHQENDKAVIEAYGFKVWLPESEYVGRLMKRYQMFVK